MQEKNAELKRLNSLKCDDIAPRKSRKKLYLYNAIRVIAFLACAALLVYSLFRISDNILAYRAGDEYYQSIKDSFLSSSSESNLGGMIYNSSKNTALDGFDEMLENDGQRPIESSPEKVEKYLEMKSKLTELKKSIRDLYGWITINGTRIDYPVVQGKDNMFYVTHATDRKENQAGSIFADFRCKSLPQNTKNLVIYGHNIRALGTMFNGIVNFFNSTYFDTHDTITLYTFDGIYEYRIALVEEVSIFSEYADVDLTDEEYRTLLANTAERAVMTRDIEKLTASEKIITLSTCSNSLDSANRYALVGILVDYVTT